MELSVAMRGIVKRFGAVEALSGVDLELRPGEIHALLGENGAGKTTLMNVLYGLYRADEGTVEIDGAEVAFRSPHDAIATRVGMVHQHFKLVPTLTVAENMVLGERGGVLLRKRELAVVADRLRELAERYGLDVDPAAKVWQLSVGEQQRVEILRALYRDARVLILDEPTATLTPVETERLFPKLRALAAEGNSIVFITHHLEDVISWADRITVLRHGERVGTLRRQESSAEELARMMVGRNVKPDAGRGRRGAGRGVAVRGGRKSGSMLSGGRPRGRRRPRRPCALTTSRSTVAPGEILAVAGVEGNGQPELEEALFGLRRPEAGAVALGGEDMTGAEPAELMRRGMGLVPSDRYRRGLVRDLTVAENLALDRLGRAAVRVGAAAGPHGDRKHAKELIERFSIQVSGPSQLAGTLSGGNAQRRGARAHAQPRAPLPDCGTAHPRPRRRCDRVRLGAARRRPRRRGGDPADLDRPRRGHEHGRPLLRDLPRPPGRGVAAGELDREKVGLAMGGDRAAGTGRAAAAGA